MAEVDLPRDAVLQCLRDRFDCWFGDSIAGYLPIGRGANNVLLTVVYVEEEHIPVVVLKVTLAALDISWEQFRDSCFYSFLV